MTKQKNLKRIIRERTEKTGESYTAARRQVLNARTPAQNAVARREADIRESSARTGSKLNAQSNSAGTVSEARVLQRTGRPLAQWFRVLDQFGAAERGHTEAARHLGRDHHVSGWYAQAITVAYERARGLRTINQTSKGFQVSVSRTIQAEPTLITSAFTNTRTRKAWLASADRELAEVLNQVLAKKREFTCSPRGTYGLRFRWNGAAVEIGVTPMANGRSQIVAAISRLADAKDVAGQRRRWTAVLNAVRAHLASH
jgi:hypothetical protein